MPPTTRRETFSDDDDDFIDDEDDDIGRQTGYSKKKGKGKSTGKKRRHGASTADGSYAWEAEYQRSWDVVREDESGSLAAAVNDFVERSKKRRVLHDTTTIQRGIIRHLYIVIDLSLSMLDKDLRPSRLELSLQHTRDFLGEFFDQNPISQVCILGTKDGIAERISPLSSNPVDHERALSNKSKLQPSGEPSLQNALEMARAGLGHLPTHGSREVVIIFGSLTTCDPGNLHSTIESLEKDRVRVCIIGLSAEVSVCRDICRRTNGTYGVVLNEEHFKDLLFELVRPPAAHRSAGSKASLRGTPATSNAPADIMLMGFPKMVSSRYPTLCSCHSKLFHNGYICPRCKSKLCEIPVDCSICNMTVVSSPHLARSYRHLFPIASFLEVNGPPPDNREPESECFGCSFPFPDVRPASSNEVSTASHTSAVVNHISQTGRYECTKCHHHFCLDCDVLIHEALGVCPGCG